MKNKATILSEKSKNEKEKKEIENIQAKAEGICCLEDKSPVTECLIHGMNIVSICLNNFCNENYLLCNKCFRLGSHKSHLYDVKYLEFLEDEILEESDLFEKICYLKNKIREDKKLQNIISDMLEVMMKIQSYFSSILEKSLNDLNNLEKNYSEKKVIISDQIHSILNKLQSKEKLADLRNRIRIEKYENFEKSEMFFDKLQFSEFIEKIKDFNKKLLSCNEIKFSGSLFVTESFPIFRHERKHGISDANQYSIVFTQFFNQSLIKFSFEAEKSYYYSPKYCGGVGILDSNSSLDFSNFTGSFVNLLDNSLINMSSNKEITDDYKSKDRYIYGVELDLYSNIFKVVCGDYIWKSTINLLNNRFKIFILLAGHLQEGFSEIRII